MMRVNVLQDDGTGEMAMTRDDVYKFEFEGRTFLIPRHVVEPIDKKDVGLAFAKGLNAIRVFLDCRYENVLASIAKLDEGTYSLG